MATSLDENVAHDQIKNPDNIIIRKSYIDDYKSQAVILILFQNGQKATFSHKQHFKNLT